MIEHLRFKLQLFFEPIIKYLTEKNNIRNYYNKNERNSNNLLTRNFSKYGAGKRRTII